MRDLIEQVYEPGQTELVDVIDVFCGMNSDRPVTVAHPVNLPCGLLDAWLSKSPQNEAV